MKTTWLLLLLGISQVHSQVFEKFEGNGFDDVRRHYTVTHALLGAMAGAALAGSNAELISGDNAIQISLGVGGAVLGGAIGGYLGYPARSKLSGGFESFYFTMADGFIGAVVLGFTGGFLADAVFPQSGDVPVSGILGGLIGGLGGGLLGGVYGYRFAIRF